MRSIAIVGSALCTCVLLNADIAEQKKRLELELRHVPIPELPARAAQIVRSTPAVDRSQAAVVAVESIVARYPASAATVVAAISKTSPEVAPAAAAAAVKLAPADSENIQNAARVAPAKADKARPVSGNNGKRIGENRRDGSGGIGNDRGNGNGNGHGHGHSNRPDKPEHPGQPGRPDKSDLLPNGKPRPFPHHGHTDDPNHVHKPNKPRPYNKPRPH
jgi:hypothetical protein